MALFEYFPNYIWNLSVAIALESGGQIGEIIDMKLKMEVDMKADEAKLASLKKLLDENPELRDKLLK